MPKNKCCWGCIVAASLTFLSCVGDSARSKQERETSDTGFPSTSEDKQGTGSRTAKVEDGWQYFSKTPGLNAFKLKNLMKPAEIDAYDKLSKVVAEADFRNASPEKVHAFVDKLLPKGFRWSPKRPMLLRNGFSLSQHCSLMELIDIYARFLNKDFHLEKKKDATVLSFTGRSYTRDCVAWSLTGRKATQKFMDAVSEDPPPKDHSVDCRSFLRSHGIDFPPDRNGVRGQAILNVKTGVFYFSSFPFHMRLVEKRLVKLGLLVKPKPVLRGRGAKKAIANEEGVE